MSSQVQGSEAPAARPAGSEVPESCPADAQRARTGCIPVSRAMLDDLCCPITLVGSFLHHRLDIALSVSVL